MCQGNVLLKVRASLEICSGTSSEHVTDERVNSKGARAVSRCHTNGLRMRAAVGTGSSACWPPWTARSLGNRNQTAKTSDVVDHCGDTHAASAPQGCTSSCRCGLFSLHAPQLVFDGDACRASHHQTESQPATAGASSDGARRRVIWRRYPVRVSRSARASSLPRLGNWVYEYSYWRVGTPCGGRGAESWRRRRRDAARRWPRRLVRCSRRWRDRCRAS